MASNIVAPTCPSKANAAIELFTKFMIYGLLASRLRASNIGAIPITKLFLILFHISPKVIGILLNRSSISPAALNIALLMTSAVINPSDDAFFMSIPFNSFLIACASIGAFSNMLLNSSPCSLPEAIAWVS